jgi:WG containing repeat
MNAVRSRCWRPSVRWLILLAFTLNCACLSRGQDELLVVVQDGKYGYIDHSGKVVIRPQFIWAEDFWRGLGTVYVCGQYLSIDSSGSLLPLRIAVQGRLEPKREGEKVGFVDDRGHFEISPTFDDALPFSGGMAAIKINDKWGFINKEGHIVIQPKFSNAYYFREGVGIATLGDSGEVLIDEAGKILATGYGFVASVSEGRVPAVRDRKSGYLDLQGKVVIPIVYDEVLSFSEGLAAVERDNKWGYVDHDGRTVIPFTLDEAGQFGNGLAPAKAGARTGFINKSGNFALELRFSYAPGFLTGDQESNNLVATTDVSRFWTDDHKFGYVDSSGKVIWGPIEGSPDHPPIFGWTAEAITQSCEGISETVRNRIAGFVSR